MSTLVTTNRKAVAGIAAAMLVAGVSAGIVSATNPGFTRTFSANAAEVVTGQAPAISTIVNSNSSAGGAFASK